MTTIEFKSATCADWFIWETYVSAHDAERALAATKARYGTRYEWRVRDGA